MTRPPLPSPEGRHEGRDFTPDSISLRKGRPSIPGPPDLSFCDQHDNCNCTTGCKHPDGSPAQNDPVHNLLDAARFNLDHRLTEKHNGEHGIKETRRVEHESGMIRDTTEGKTNWLLVFDGPLLQRWAEHMTRGAATKGRRNWMKAGDNPVTAEADLERFREGLVRHMAQFLAGESDEDHAAALAFNLNGMLLVEEKIRNGADQLA